MADGHCTRHAAHLASALVEKQAGAVGLAATSGNLENAEDTGTGTGLHSIYSKNP